MSQVAVQNRCRAKALFHPAVVFVLLMSLAASAFAGSVTLAWDPVVDSRVAGYMLHYGPSAGNYTTKIDVGNTATRTVTNLTDGVTYHFAVAAYDSSRIASPFSNDVSATVALGAPVASFTASTTSGVAPLALNFTDTSTGAISSYAWTFGDSTTSTTKSPSHVYAAPGVYTVSLTVSGSAGSNTKTMSSYITVKAVASTDTLAPIAPSALVASAGGTTVINLSWKAATDNVAVTGYRIERCQGVGCASFAYIATSTGTTFSNTGLVAGTSYSYRVRAMDAVGNAGAYSNIATAKTTSTAPSSTGVVFGSVLASTAKVDMTSTGSSDWARWPSYIHNSSGRGQIRDVVMLGGGVAKAYYGDARTVTWSNGLPIANGSSTTGVFTSGTGTGFQLTAPADTNTRTLKLYVGAQNTSGTLTAHLSDGSAADYVGTVTGQSVRQNGVMTIQYRAASAGQSIVVEWTQTGSGSGNITLQGAALAVGAVP